MVLKRSGGHRAEVNWQLSLDSSAAWFIGNDVAMICSARPKRCLCLSLVWVVYDVYDTLAIQPCVISRCCGVRRNK
jgi:hypothetical protein